eukprot:TRINITY_DN6535_c0_g1_i1.p1 TRINITY_DN6535_c0_g1~~TRINITY_DN6535_c0_g1_i1.p1  ORF type:complete len:105 (-),score=38.38 TRINITY_DN6535_c0_g1_i1:21-335(-)
MRRISGKVSKHHGGEGTSSSRKGELQVKFDQLSKNLIKGMKHMKQMKQEAGEKDKELMDAKSELEELSQQLQKNSQQKSETELLQNGEIEETKKKKKVPTATLR